jgi:tetratricopeptide (TPR) repeat protein
VASQDDVILAIRHLFKLNNFRSATLVAQHLDLRTLTPRDMFVVLRAMLSSDQGVQADEHIEWFLRSELGHLTESDQVALAKLIFASGLTAERKVRCLEETAAKLRVGNALTPHARRQFRYQEYRVRTVSEDRVDTLQYAEMGNHAVDQLRDQMPYFSFLRDRGYNDVVENALGKLIRTYGAKDASVWISAFKYNATWAVAHHPELLSPPDSLRSRLDIMEAAYANRSVDDRLNEIAEAALALHMRKYAASDVYAKDKLLRTLLRMERFDECNSLIQKDAALLDLVLPAHNIRGMRYLKDGDYPASKDAFGRVLNEDPSDSFAGQGMRYSLVRTGGSPKTILAVRDRIGYGISSSGRIGSTSRIGSDQIIAHLYSGEYTEGLYGKRHAPHWQLLKRVYGRKFLNYEFIPLKKAAQQHIFIMGDEGVSDEARTAQYYDFLIKTFKKVTITCDPRFLPIFQRTWPKAEFLPVQRLRKGVAKPTSPLRDRISNFDLKLSDYLTEECRPYMEAADYITFGQNIFFNHFAGRIPRPEPGPYLDARPAPLPSTQKLRVGLQWRSGFVSTWRKFMYFDLKDLSALTSIQGVEFWALQHHMSDEETEYCRQNGILMADDVDLYNDFDAVASYTGAMDLMIGLSSFPIEMGCGVGTPAWMLGFSPENYFLRTSGGKDESDRLSLNSKVLAPSWIDFSMPVNECIKVCVAEAQDRIERILSVREETESSGIRLDVS